MKGKPVSMDNGKEREEITPFPTKLKTKKLPTTKKENQVEKSRFVQRLLVLGGFGRNNFWDILYNLQASRRRYQYARDSLNYWERWDVCRIASKQLYSIKKEEKKSCSVRFSVVKFNLSFSGIRISITIAASISTIKHLSSVFTVQAFHVK